MPIEIRMAWREIRPALKKFVFMVAAIALGVGSVTGIKGFGQALDRAILRSARDLIASDLAVRFPSAPNAEETAVLSGLERRGATMTRVTETVSMVSPRKSVQPILSGIKAVDPGRYPFFGKVDTEPPARLDRLLDDSSALVSREFFTRTGASVGDEIRLGNSTLRIAAVLVAEPDRVVSGAEFGPRVLVTRKALQDSGLIQFGSRAQESFLYRLPAQGLDLETARGALKAGLQRQVRIVDYRNPNPSVSRGLERMANFLSLVGLLALLVGGLGVATTVHSYLQQKLDTIAVLKCLGARSRQIISIYLVQGLALGGIGSLLGVGLGYLVQLVFPSVLRGMIALPTNLEPAPGAVLQGFLIGITTTLLFLLPPLLAVRKVRPSRVFLREMPETRMSTLRRLRNDPLPLLLSVALVGGVGLLASWLAESWARGFGFLAGLAGAVVVLGAGARLLLALVKRAPRPRSLTLRHALRNLNRPGSHVASVLVSIGIGVAFVLSVYLIQTSLITQIVKSAPANFPNMFLLGIPERDKTALWEFLRAQSQVTDAGDPIPAIPSRLVRVDGKTEGERNLEASDRRYSQIEFILTWAAALPPDTKIVEGQWWRPPFDSPAISVGQYAARWLKIGVGSTLEFSSSGRTVRGRVANIRDVDFARPGSSNQFIFSPGSLDGLPASYFGALRVSPGGTAVLQRDLFSRYPNVSSIDVGQVLVRVQDILDRIAGVIRFIGVFAILSGVIILAASVASTRYQRIREAALLKTLGATRSRVARIQATEFLVVGLAAGLIGSLLAAVTAKYLLGRLLDTEFEMRWFPLLAGTVATAALAILTGWIASRGVLNHKPLEVLREN